MAIQTMDTRYHGYVNYSPSSSVSSTTVEMMGPMGQSLVRIYDKITGNLRSSYWQTDIDLTNTNASVASPISIINCDSPSLSSSTSSVSLACLDGPIECVFFFLLVFYLTTMKLYFSFSHHCFYYILLFSFITVPLCRNHPHPICHSPAGTNQKCYITFAPVAGLGHFQPVVPARILPL